MPDREKVFDALRNCITEPKCKDCPWETCEEFHQTKTLPLDLCLDILKLLKEQEAMNVDAFVQWCIDSHIMGDATVRGIKYWVGKYKEIKEGR